MFYCEFCKISMITFFTEDIRATACVLITFEEETNMFVPYNEEFIKSGVMLNRGYGSFHSQKWGNREILFKELVKTRIHCISQNIQF